MTKKNIKKNAVIFVPHEDDEIFVCGPVLKELLKKFNCYVVFMTNGDYEISGDIRVKEAYRSLKVLGVKHNNIIFLGYPDQYAKENEHFYIDSKKYCSTQNKYFTQNTRYSIDFSFKIRGKHAILCRESLHQDIYKIIEELQPDILLSVDYDSHPDHRVLSMAFDKAIGQILLDKKGYEPIVLKTYAYSTMCSGYDDFSVRNLIVSKYKDDYEGNPFYYWNDRDRFPIVANKIFIFNRLFLASIMHISQSALSCIDRIINSDFVFWNRRTDNLLRNCDFNVLKLNKLRDFCLICTNDIMNFQPISNAIFDFSSCYDLQIGETLQITLDREYEIENIVLYLTASNQGKCRLVISAEQNKFLIESYNKFSKINQRINMLNVNLIQIENLSPFPIYISQVEVFQHKEIEYKTIFVVIFDSADKKIYYTGNQISFEVFCLEKFGRKKKLQIEECNISFKGDNDKIAIIGNTIYLDKTVNRLKIKVELKTNSSIFWETKLIRLNKYYVFLHKIIFLFNMFTIKIFRKMTRLVNRLYSKR